MDNYHYIIAGLPDLMLDSENKGFRYEETRNEIYGQCSPEDRRLIDWLEFGGKEENLNSHFYRAALSHKNKFISRFFDLDLQIRNSKVDYLSRKNKSPKAAQAVKNPDDALRMEKYKILPAGATEPEAADRNRLQSIFETSGILEKEQMLDRFKWEKINEFTVFDYFNIDKILAFLAKAKMIDRWNKLDKQTGREMFRKLVEEVRGTFKGVGTEPRPEKGTDPISGE